MTDIVAGTDNRYEEWCRDCAIVTRGLDLACKKFFEIGAALARIRDSKSYLSVRVYNTFEDCCDKQFGISRGHAYRLIDAAAVYADLAPPRGDKTLQLSLSPPISEAQCRPLVRLTSEQRKAVWKKVIAENPGGPPTAQKLTAAVGAITGAPQLHLGSNPDRTIPISLAPAQLRSSESPRILTPVLPSRSRSFQHQPTLMSISPSRPRSSNTFRKCQNPPGRLESSLPPHRTLPPS